MSYAATMSRSPLLRKARPAVLIHRAKKSAPSQTRFFLAVTLLGLLLVGGVYHLANLNAMSVKGHEINRLQAQIHELSSRERELLVSLGEGGTLSDVQTFASNHGFVPQGVVKFIEPKVQTPQLANR